jgi:hypothetical protein
MQTHALVHEPRGIERQVTVDDMAVLRHGRRGAIAFRDLAR